MYRVSDATGAPQVPRRGRVVAYFTSPLPRIRMCGADSSRRADVTWPRAFAHVCQLQSGVNLELHIVGVCASIAATRDPRVTRETNRL